VFLKRIYESFPFLEFLRTKEYIFLFISVIPTVPFIGILIMENMGSKYLKIQTQMIPYQRLKKKKIPKSTFIGKNPEKTKTKELKKKKKREKIKGSKFKESWKNIKFLIEWEF